MELLKSSSMLATVGAMDAAEASESLTAIMNSYKLEVSDVMGVVDKLTELDLEAATSAEELAVALQRVAAFSSTAGVSMDKMLGILTTVSSTTRLSAKIFWPLWT